LRIYEKGITADIHLSYDSVDKGSSGCKSTQKGSG